MALGDILELIAKYGLGPVVLCIAVWYLNRQNEKSNQRAEDERKAFREERDKRITVCEQHIMECNQDRAAIRAELRDERNRLQGIIDKLQEEVRSLLRMKHDHERTKH